MCLLSQAQFNEAVYSLYCLQKMTVIQKRVIYEKSSLNNVSND